MDTRAIVIIFQGEEVTAEEIGTTCAYLNQCNKTVMDVVAFNAKDIGTAMLHECKIVDMGSHCDEESHRTPEDEAVILVGTVMKAELGHDYTRGMFVASLIDRIRKAKKYPTKAVNREFMNALFILSQENLRVSKSLLEAYNLDEDRITIIKETYNFITKFLLWVRRGGTNPQKNATFRLRSLNAVINTRRPHIVVQNLKEVPGNRISINNINQNRYQNGKRQKQE